jgi:single-strand DNA-binding protein
LNKVFLIGNLTKDPENRATQSGVSKCNFTVAVQRKDKQADFIPVVAWRGLAETCGKYLAKGRQVAVIGSIQTRSYDTADGKRHVTEVVADEVQFLSKGGSGGKFGEEQDTPLNTQDAEFEPMDGDDLPF